jgi:transcriptional regulator with GAF, ATPase, and Fis domain
LHALRLTQEDAPERLTEMSAMAGAPVAIPQVSATDRMATLDTRAIAALEVSSLLRARDAEKRPAALDRALPEMLGDSAAMREMARIVRLVAPRSTTVLIEGETGTGKDLVARAIHRLSPRSAKAFVVLNCAAIPESLLEAELFGHTRGAFTGAVQSRTGRIEAADGGTLFLDEIGEMPLALQAKMLRFLESGELQRVGDNATTRVDVRVVAATHQPLQLRVAEKAFRLDLYHRLAVFPVAIPPLRERMEEVLPLAEYLLARLGEEMPMKRLSAGASSKLMQHDWPGNVRELAHVLERAAILAEDRMEIAKAEIWF